MHIKQLTVFVLHCWLGVMVSASVEYAGDSLYEAARVGDVAAVERLLRSECDIDRMHGIGEVTPLRAAIQNGHEAIVCLLIAGGADIERVASDSWTPLLGASVRGNAGIVRVLLEAGSDIDRETMYGWTPLLESANRGHEAVVHVLLHAGADVYKEVEGVKRTALGCAIIQKQNSTAELLLCAGLQIGDWVKDLSQEQKEWLLMRYGKIAIERAAAVRGWLDERAQEHWYSDMKGKRQRYSEFYDDLQRLIGEFEGSPISRQQLTAALAWTREMCQ